MSDVVRLRKDKLEWREVEGEVVALDGTASEYLAVNRSGAELWPLLAEGATRVQLAARLSEAFGLDADRAAEDVEAFLAALDERGLLER